MSNFACLLVDFGEVLRSSAKRPQWRRASRSGCFRRLKMALFDCAITMKNVAVLTEDGAFALFFRPHPGGFDRLMPGGQPGGRGLGAGGID